MQVFKSMLWMIIGASWFALGLPHAHAEDSHHKAHATNHSRFHAGCKAGLNVTTYGGDHGDTDIVESTGKLGFEVGGFLSFDAHPAVAIASEVTFATRGSRFKVAGEDVGSYDLSYLQIPVLVQIRVPLANRIRPYGLGGAAVGVLLSATSHPSDGMSADIKDMYSSVDLALLFGIGSEIQLSSRGTIVLDVRYVRGLLDIDQREQPEVDIENRAFSILVGYQHRFGGRASAR